MSSNYEVTMQHTEESFLALSHMQYNLFCEKDRIMRTIISIVLIVVGVVYFENWWGILLVAYGCYLTTSKYLSANRTAHKLSEQIKLSGKAFPASRYVFCNKAMEIYHAKEKQKEDSLNYDKFYKIGEDAAYFYIFRDEYGGYMIPKESLGEKQEKFRNFLENKTGQSIQGSRVPIVRFINWLKRRHAHK